MKKNPKDTGLLPLPLLPGYHTSFEACQTRNLFAMYFHSKEGYIPWQDKCAHVTDLQD